MHPVDEAGMHMSLSALLEELFALHGHHVTAEAPLEGRSGTVYTIPILAEHQGRAVVVSGHLDGSAVTPEAVAEFAATVADVGADQGILVHTGPCAAGTRDAALGRVLLWDRDSVVRFLGEAQLARSLEEIPPALPLTPAAESAEESVLATSIAEVLPPAFLVPEPAIDMSLLADLLSPAPETAPQIAPAGHTLDAFAVEAPRRPSRPAQPQEDDFHPFPPISPQVMLPLPAPPWDLEHDMLPPEHPLSIALPAIANAMLQPVMVTEARQVAAAPPSWAPVAPAAAAPRAFLPAMSTPAAAPAPKGVFGSIAASAQAFGAGAPSVPAPLPQAPAPAPAAPMPATPPAPPTPAVIVQAPNALPPFATASLPVLPVRVRVEDAKRRVKDRLFSIRAVEILLQPVHLFEYECDVLKEGSLTFDTLDGRIQVHGSDKSTLDVDPDQTNPLAPSLLSGGHPYAVEERVLRIPEDRARALAFQHAVKKHTRQVSVRVPDHNNSLFYTEKRKVEPTSDQVRLRHLGVHLRPVWRLHGANGIVDVDATDGREVMAEVRGGRTDSMIIE